MEEGCAVSAGISRPRAASTVRRSSSKNGGSFIAAGNGRAAGCLGASRFSLPLGIERLGGKLAIGFLQEDFHSPLRLFQLLLALARKRDALLKQFHCVVQRELRAFQAPDDFLKTGERALKIGLFRWFGFHGRRKIHAICPCPLEAPISDSARNNKLTGRPAQCAGSALRSGGRVSPRVHRREEYFPTPGTTTPDRESRAPDANSILRHARERTQLLCARGAIPAVSTHWRGGEGRGERAITIRKSRCCQDRQRALDPAGSPSRDALTRRAIG